ncbi:ABC transporter ATP-binding protein [Pseudomonas graminis]
MSDILKLMAQVGDALSGLRRMVWLTVLDAFLASVPYALLFYILLDMLSAQPGLRWQFTLAAGCLLLMVVRVLLARVLNFNLSLMGFRAGYQLRKSLGEHLRRLPMGFFYRNDMTSVNNTLLKDIDMSEKIFTHLYAPLIASLSVVCFFALGLLLKDWRMGLAMLSTLPLAVLAFVLTRQYARRWQSQMQSLMFRLNDALMEYIDGIKELKASRMTGAAFSRLDKVLETTWRQSLKAEKASAWPTYSFNLLVECGFIVLLAAVSWAWLGQTLPLAEVLVFLIAAVRFFRPLLNISMFLAELNYFGLAAERIARVFDLPVMPEGNDQPRPDSLRIRLDNVSFAYPDKPRLFDGLNLTLEAHKVTALVGPSGSGKSTLASLIARFWALEQGTIWVGSESQRLDTAALETSHWQSYISVVFQQSYVLNDTIANNLRVAMPQASMQALRQVCAAARLLPLIDSFPDGMDTLVGAGGVHLSGGELQRLSIARALLKDAPLIILDEASASLDPENERDIQLAMQSLTAGKTVLVIAHKLSSVRYADHIVVMDEGRIAEQGNHQQLIAQQGLYAEMWQLQQQAMNWRPVMRS